MADRNAKPRASSDSHAHSGGQRAPLRTDRASGAPASRLIDQRIREIGGWRGLTLARMRSLILEADPDATEEWKWMGTPVWSHAGNICTGEVYQKGVKLTFAQGAALDDPEGLFNASLTGNTRRAIDIREGEQPNADAFRALIRAAVAENLRRSTGKADAQSSSGAKAKQRSKTAATPRARAATKKSAQAKPSRASSDAPVVLLSGGNPQIAKADGDAPVQKYIAAMPGWKQGLGRQLDALIVRHVPDVRKAVRWNSPFYGIEGQGWFLSFHVLTRYVKVTFFRGMSLLPIPTGGTPKSQECRWIDIYEDQPLDEEQMAAWVKQAAALPGWVP